MAADKSYACLLEPTYHIHNPQFEAVIFRRIRRQITGPGGLYKRSLEIYPQLGGRFNKSDLVWTFPSGATVRFAYMQYEEDVESWKGTEIPLIEVDEVTEMSEYQFFYLLSRNRSLCGVTPYMRAFTNPDSESWVKTILAPWVDEDFLEDNNVPAHWRHVAESGEVRWFVRENDTIRWCDADTPFAISITFIRADVYDNKLLMEKDPGYMAGLEALPEMEKRRLKYGDWSARPSGKKFRREWFKHVFDEMPADIERFVRFWDKAASEEPKKNSRKSGPDYTAGVLIGRRRAGAYPRYVVLDALWERKDPGGVEELIKTIAEQDGRHVEIRIEEEGGSSGKDDIFNFVTKVLEGFAVEGKRSSGSKEIRANTFSSQAKIGNVGLMRGTWNKGFLNFLVAFPDPTIHDDVPDAASGAMNELFLTYDGPLVWSADTPTVRKSPEIAPVEDGATLPVMEIESPLRQQEDDFFDPRADFDEDGFWYEGDAA